MRSKLPSPKVVLLLFILCFLALKVYLPSSTNASYEITVLNVFKDLKAGNYDAVEQFFVDAHQNKRLTTAGREYIESAFDRWYDTKHNLSDDTLQHINGWAKKYPDSPFALLARSEYFYEKAWEKRSYRFSKNVFPEQWSLYYRYLEEAKTALGVAVSKDKTIPYAYTIFTKILAQTGDKTRATTLVKAAEQQNLYDIMGVYRAYMFFALTPKWGGDATSLLSFARSKAQYAPKNSLLPTLVSYAHAEIVSELPVAQRSAYYKQTGVWEEVANGYEQAIKAYPKGAVWALNYGLAASVAGDQNKAAAMFNKAMSMDPDYSATYAEAGKLYMQPSTYPMAEKAYRRYALLRPDAGEPYRQLAYIKIRQGDYAAAVAFADKGASLEPTRCIFSAHRCLAHLKMGQLQTALVDCNTAISIDKYCRVAYLNRADVYRELGQEQKSAEDKEIYQKLK